MQSTVGGVISLDPDQVELVLDHRRGDRFERVVGEQVVEVALVGELQPMMGEERLDQELGEGAELYQAGARIAVDVGFGEATEIGEFAVIIPQEFEVTRFHEEYGCRRKTKNRRRHCCLGGGFVWGKFGTHIRAVGYGTECAKRLIVA